MRIDNELAQLRGEPVALAKAKEMMAFAHSQWAASLEMAPIVNELKAYAAGQELASLTRLSELFTSHDTAKRFVAQWCRAFARALAAEPLALVPSRHHHVDGLTTMQLISERGAAISLAVYEEVDGAAAPGAVVFDDRSLVEHVVAGAAQADLHRITSEEANAAQITSHRLSLAPGKRIETIGNRSARHITRVQGRLLLLQLARIPDQPALTREYALPSGQLLMQSSGDKRASQREMAMAVLGAMGRSAAAAAIANLAGEGPDHLRWEAVRHTLALDTALGIRLLARMADDSEDRLSDQAARLCELLQRTYPQLVLIDGDEICPA